ncbi:MAG: nucleoside triphosphate pyrophosphohydrolase [Oscillospiraceae bacterium]|jgi:tetrapyrrole methylase family protein/MazG family protein|nr:nucleoside triphosphate pyrophosphohydrolase [Oscillospiraceae bacterium]
MSNETFQLKKPALVLASGSPRRREILRAAGYIFEVVPARAEETLPDGVSPEEAVTALARRKAASVGRSGDTVIGADTLVVCESAILGKPSDAGDASRMLRMLSGRRHAVYTGVCVTGGGVEETFYEKSFVDFYPLTDGEIADYIKTGEPFDKAGAYGIQGAGMLLVKGIVGDFYNVMGLPAGAVSRTLGKFGHFPGNTPGAVRGFFEQKRNYGIDDLIEIMAFLRGARGGKGCPWDMEQTHASIRSNVIEEAYEVAEAIDSGSDGLLREELGDLLLQAVFHAQMASERGAFDFGGVCDGICKKLIYRHPHVFGELKADTADEVLKNWDELKSDSKGEETVADRLSGVSAALPALIRGEKVGKRAANAGFDFTDAKAVTEILKTELDGLENASLNDNGAEIEEKFGNVLFMCCNLGRFLKKDSEKALTIAVNKFIMRFRGFEHEKSRGAEGREKGRGAEGSESRGKLDELFRGE